MLALITFNVFLVLLFVYFTFVIPYHNPSITSSESGVAVVTVLVTVELSVFFEFLSCLFLYICGHNSFLSLHCSSIYPYAVLFKMCLSSTVIPNHLC